MEYLAALQPSRNVEKFLSLFPCCHASATTSLAAIFQTPILPQSVPQGQDVTRFKKTLVGIAQKCRKKRDEICSHIRSE
jgi:hypothetical protein